LALDGGQWSASRPGRFNTGERTSDTHWIGGWVGQKPVWKRWWREKSPYPCRESNPSRPAPSPVTMLSELCRM